MKKISSFIYYYFQQKRFIITIPFVYSFFKKKNPIMEVEMNGQMVKIPFNHMGLRYQREYENYAGEEMEEGPGGCGGLRFNRDRVH